MVVYCRAKLKSGWDDPSLYNPKHDLDLPLSSSSRRFLVGGRDNENGNILDFVGAGTVGTVRNVQTSGIAKRLLCALVSAAWDALH
jgi:hypothetical protein